MTLVIDGFSTTRPSQPWLTLMSLRADDPPAKPVPLDDSSRLHTEGRLPLRLPSVFQIRKARPVVSSTMTSGSMAPPGSHEVEVDTMGELDAARNGPMGLSAVAT